MNLDLINNGAPIKRQKYKICRTIIKQNKAQSNGGGRTGPASFVLKIIGDRSVQRSVDISLGHSGGPSIPVARAAARASGRPDRKSVV